jgi:hypothetical protein
MLQVRCLSTVDSLSGNSLVKIPTKTMLHTQFFRMSNSGMGLLQHCKPCRKPVYVFPRDGFRGLHGAVFSHWSLNLMGLAVTGVYFLFFSFLAGTTRPEPYGFDYFNQTTVMHDEMIEPQRIARMPAANSCRNWLSFDVRAFFSSLVVLPFRLERISSKHCSCFSLRYKIFHSMFGVLSGCLPIRA